MEYKPLSKLFYSDREHYDYVYHNRFNSEYSIHLDFSIHNNQAFFVVEPSFLQKIIEIYKIDKKVKQLYDMLPGIAIDQFAKRCLVDEIILTNDIEGVYSSRREINSIITELKDKSQGRRFTGLVQKYRMLQSGENISFTTCEDIRSLYDDLVYNEIKEDNSDNLPDGQIFRKDCASVISATQKEIHRGINPESEIISCMNKALSILRDESIECIFRISVFHYLFGYIHPFYDGNGRTSRFISSYLLAKEFEPILGYRISYSIKENIKEYYNAFKICNDVHNKGDLTPFVIAFIDIIKNSMKQLVEALEKRYYALEHYRQLIYVLPYGMDSKFAELYFILMQASLFSENGISTQSLMEALDVSRQTITNRIKALPEELIVKKSFGSMNFYSINLDAVDKMEKKDK